VLHGHQNRGALRAVRHVRERLEVGGPVLASGVGTVGVGGDAPRLLVLLGADLPDLHGHRTAASFAARASAAAISAVDAFPPRSGVTCSPSARTRCTAFSRAAAAATSPTWRRSMAADRTMGAGSARPFPAMSGAL